MTQRAPIGRALRIRINYPLRQNALVRRSPVLRIERPECGWYVER